MRLELAFFLALLAVAVAVAHVAVTCRDRGNITSVTLMIGVGRGLMLLRKALAMMVQGSLRSAG